MNDLELINTIQKCLDHGYPSSCETCFYNGKDRCSNIMMQDAVSVMKMQHNALKGFAEELAKKDAEIARWKPMARYSFDEDTLVKTVNDIIYACMDDFDDYDDGGNAYRRMLEVILKLGQMLPGQYKVEIVGMECPPKLVKE